MYLTVSLCVPRTHRLLTHYSIPVRTLITMCSLASFAFFSPVFVCSRCALRCVSPCLHSCVSTPPCTRIHALISCPHVHIYVIVHYAHNHPVHMYCSCTVGDGDGGSVRLADGLEDALATRHPWSVRILTSTHMHVLLSTCLDHSICSLVCLPVTHSLTLTRNRHTTRQDYVTTTQPAMDHLSALYKRNDSSLLAP